MGIDYQKIEKELSEFGHYVLSSIKNDYKKSLNPNQLEQIKLLLKEKKLIVIDKPIDISNQNSDLNYISSSHGHDNDDNKIHIYLHIKKEDNDDMTNKIISTCINEIIINEMFHYFINLNVNGEIGSNNGLANFLNNGLVYLYAVDFAQRHRLTPPNNNFHQNVEISQLLLDSLKEDTKKEDIDKIIFNANCQEILTFSPIGNDIINVFREQKLFESKIDLLILDIANILNIDDDNTASLINYYRQMSNKILVVMDLLNQFEYLFKDNKAQKKTFTTRLKEINKELYEIAIDQLDNEIIDIEKEMTK